jgi:hypothetical protein
MCDGTLVAIREREPDSFNSLLERLISAMYRLQLVADNLNSNDLAGISQKHVPGAYVIAEVPRKLEKLHDDFGYWHDTHEHTPKAKGVKS